MPIVDSAAFKAALVDYDNIALKDNSGNVITLDTAITALDRAIAIYADAQSDTDTSTERNKLQATLNPISNYSAKLTAITNTVQKYIDDSSQLVQVSQDSLLNEERYINRLYPENSVNSREVLFGFLPQIRPSSIPYILAVSIFMISLSVFFIFQMAGVTGQLNLPPYLTQWYSSYTTPAVGSIPFYKNPMVLGGVILLLLIIAVIFIILYAKSKNTNKD